MYRLMENYWRAWFPRWPSYQTFVLRLNRLEPTFQTFGAIWSDALAATRSPEIDHIVDSLPVMLAHHKHSYGARVARDIADVGFCTAKKTRFHGVRRHWLAQRRTGRLPLPSQVWLCAASHHDSKNDPVKLVQGCGLSDLYSAPDGRLAAEQGDLERVDSRSSRC